jgi:hypothetical protein
MIPSSLTLVEGQFQVVEALQAQKTLLPLAHDLSAQCLCLANQLVVQSKGSGIVFLP